MALISPGVQVTIIDESQYSPTSIGSIPYILIATEQDKINTNGSVASYTTKANAGKLATIVSQRDLVLNYGTPTFQVDASGAVLNAHELSEYGLMAAYSALGVSNQVYIQRADVNLAELVGTSIRPTGTPADGTYWFDLSHTNFGAYEWNASTKSFALQTPALITDPAHLSAGVPIPEFGAIGSYAVNTINTSNPIYYKKYDNTWVLVGTDAWQQAHPAIIGTIAATNLVTGDNFQLNGVNVTVGTATVSALATTIGTTVPGLIATVNSIGQLELRINSTAASTGNIAAPDGALTITAGATNDAAVKLGLLTGNITTITVNTPTVQFDTYRNTPAWRTSDVTPRPSGSVWFKTSATGNGATWTINEYNATLQTWNPQTAPLYLSDASAIYGLDPTGGGAQIAVGSVYVKYDTDLNLTGKFKPYVKNVSGLLKITGTTPTTPYTFVNGNSFIMEVSVPGSQVLASATVTLAGTTAQALVGAILAAGLPNIVALVETTGAISISHLAGGTIKFTNVIGTPLFTAGITVNSHVQTLATGVYLASPFTELDYTYSTTAPYTDPADGTLWYYNSPLDVDILINNGSAWKGYRTVGVDARGYDLTATDEAGPILAATQPLLQSGGGQLVKGDLWIDTGDLENYPVIRRFNENGVWELIDNTDQVGIDGVVFADARWATNNTVDPITDALPTIASLALSDYLDDDAPDYRLYPRGTLLFNTRRTGYNVKKFDSALGAWVSHSTLDQDGVPYFGHKAQRSVVVAALKAAVGGSTALREDQTQFNLICCPGYPELMNDLIVLNNDRKQTAFVIGDTPLTLNPNDITTWATNQNLAADNGDNGLVSNSEYLGVYYPSGLGTDLSGNSIVVPASHIMLRTIIRSDNVSYPWFAPAGVRRGVIDNVSSIGYVDTTDNNLYVTIGVSQGLRDVLYGNRINPITVLPGVGIVAYGQKTRSPMVSSMDRINVARLINYLRVVFNQAALPFIFEPNDTITRLQVKAAFESILNDVVAKRGVYDYLVVCDDTNNTPDRIDRNELYIDIAIKPVKAIEFVYIPVRLLNTGAALTQQ